MEKKQILLILGIAILLIGIPVGIILVSRPLGFRLGAKDPNKPENVSVSNIAAQNVTVTWTTSSAVQGGVSYGLSTNSMTLFKPEAGPAVNHSVSLDGLVAASKYYFVIKAGGQTFDDEGQSFTFTTAQAKAPTPTPTTPSLTEAGFLAAMGTTNSTYDLNKDGIVNTLDLELFRQQQTK